MMLVSFVSLSGDSELEGYLCESGCAGVCWDLNLGVRSLWQEPKACRGKLVLVGLVQVPEQATQGEPTVEVEVEDVFAAVLRE